MEVPFLDADGLAPSKRRQQLHALCKTQARASDGLRKGVRKIQRRRLR